MGYTKKLSNDELRMAVSILYSHYQIGFCNNAEELAQFVSLEFDCNCTQNEAYPYYKEPINEELDINLMMKNIMM